MLLFSFLACKGPAPAVPTDATDPPPPACLALPASLAVPNEGEGVYLELPRIGTASVVGDFVLDAGGSTSVDAPGALFVRGSGQGELTVELEGCDPQSTILIGRRDPGLGAMLLPDAPGHTALSSFPSGSSPRVALDPGRWPRLQGEVDVWLVEGPIEPGVTALVDTRGAPTPVTIDGLTLVDLGPQDPPVPTALQVVVDLDRDGTFSSLDLRDTIWTFPPLHLGGPHLTEHAELSEDFFRTMRVFWPTGLDTFDGPRPVVVLAHGNGHDYTWYDDLLQHLASWGYVAMAFRCDTEPGIEAATTTLIDNTDLLLTRPGDVHPDLAGQLDVTRIAWIGHSRGGEAVFRGAERLRNGESTTTLDVASLKLISGIAPTVFLGPNPSAAGEIPVHLLLGGADGDITQGPVTPGLPFRCDFCKSKRLLQRGESSRAVHYLHGAIHNDFNCCGMDDGFLIQSPKIGRNPARAYQRAVTTALLGHHLLEQPGWLELIERVPHALPDTGLPVSVMVQPGPDRLRMLDDFQEQPEAELASSGAAVTHSLVDYAEAVFRDNNLSYAYNENDPMNGMSESEGENGIAERGAVFSFTDDVSWEVAIDGIEATDRTLALRLAQSTRHPLTVGLDDALSFSIALVGAQTTTLPSASYQLVNAPYPRGGSGQGTGWTNEFVTVRIPLTDFETAGADLSTVTAVRLSFGPSHGSAQGRVALDAVRFER